MSFEIYYYFYSIIIIENNLSSSYFNLMNYYSKTSNVQCKQKHNIDFVSIIFHQSYRFFSPDYILLLHFIIILFL